MSSDRYRIDEIQGRIIHEYDGIEEADNELPRWWLLTFYGAIFFSVLYWFYYHEYEMGPQPMQAYARALAEKAAQGGPVSEELLVALTSDKAAVAAGEKIYTDNCAQCHLKNAEGDIGPNLTDAYWINGGGPEDIHRVVSQGVGAKGMPAWLPVLGAEPVQQVTAYVMTLRGTNVSGKEPEGQLYDPSAGSAPGSAETAPSDQGAEAPSETEAESGESAAAVPTAAGASAARMEEGLADRAQIANR